MVITRDQAPGVLTKITTPNGRSITFRHDSQNRITQAMDNIGRRVSYAYDPERRLSSVTDPLVTGRIHPLQLRPET